jgi:hypothetical protein
MKWRERSLEALAVASECGWIYAAAIVVTALADDGRPPSYPSLLAAGGLAYALVRLLGRFEVQRSGVVVAFAALSVGAIYAIARLEYAGELRLFDFVWVRDIVADPGETLRGRGWIPLGVILLAGTWTRSASRALSPIAFDGVLRSFSVGFGVLLVAAMAADPIDQTAAVTGLVLPVFAGNLLALALAQSLRVDVEGQGSSRFSWFGLMAGLVFGVVGLAFVLGVIAEAGLGETAEPIGDGLRAVFVGVLFAVSLPVFYLFYGILRLGLFLSGRSEDDIRETLELTDASLRDVLVQPEYEPGAGPPDWIVMAIRAVQLLAALAVLALVLWLVYRRIRRHAAAHTEDRESVFSAEALRRDLRGLAAGWFRRKPPGPRDAAVSPLGRLYAEVLAEARRRGVERDPALTPLQFAPELLVCFESRAPLAISEAFAAQVYGRAPPAPEELRRLRSDWQRTLEGAL